MAANKKRVCPRCKWDFWQRRKHCCPGCGVRLLLASDTPMRHEKDFWAEDSGGKWIYIDDMDRHCREAMMQLDQWNEKKRALIGNWTIQ